MLIHVVDDHEMMREATVAVVRRMRKTARILDFATLDSFMRAVDDQGPPDLLVLDLILPGIKGCEGVARARDRCLHTRIAVYSALPAADQRQKCIDAGADIYIQKTFGASVFVNGLQQLLD